MTITYSKTSVDISTEVYRLSDADPHILETQKKSQNILQTFPERPHCLLCNMALQGSEIFLHRTIEYYVCTSCGHIQSKKMPSNSYPIDSNEGLSFEEVYPALSQEAYESRRDRIYAPKMNWILTCLESLGYRKSILLENAHWVELGCGAGYFIAAAKAQGIRHIQGIDANKTLCDQGNQALSEKLLTHDTQPLYRLLQKYPADIIISFFVLEHIQDAYLFWEAISAVKIGTLFVFSIPVFSFSTVLESAFSHHAGRNLDNSMHTQLYTDRSLQYALNNAGFKVLGKWLFGQDIGDLHRLLHIKLKKVYPSSLLSEFNEKMQTLLDSLQNCIDRTEFCDSQHIICIKEAS